MENKRKHLFSSKLKIIAAVLCIVVGIIFFLNPIITYMDDYMENKRVESLYKKLENNSNTHNGDKNNLNNKNIKINKAKIAQKKLVLDKYKNLLNINKDVVGWIKVENTKINYPILHYNNNEYYLHNDINRKKSEYGSIFLDYRNSKDMNNKNILIYGHNMLDHSMFNNLIYFKEHSFFDKNKYIIIDNLYKESIWEIFSVYIVDADKETVPVSFKTNEDFLHYIEKCQRRSMYKNNIKLNKNDRIATLVTCSYELKNARTIVQARLMKLKN